MSERTGESKGSETQENQSFKRHLNNLDIRDIDVDVDDIEVKVSTRQTPDGRPMLRHFEGESYGFREAARDFPKMEDETVEKLVYDLQDLTQYADFAVVLPDAAVSPLLEGEQNMSTVAWLEQHDGEYVSRAWPSGTVENILESKGFDDFVEYLDSRVFDRGRMLFVPHDQTDVESWSNLEAQLMNHSQTVISSEAEFADDSQSRELGQTLREDKDDYGRMKVEVYPGFYDDVRAEEEGSSVVVYGDGEVIARYDDFSLDSRGDYQGGPVAFELEQE